MRRMMLTIIVLCAVTGLAQQPTAAFPLTARQSAPAFEVASVKLAPPPQPVNRVVQQVSPPGTFNRTTNVAVLIQFGYDLQEYQVVGGPSWLREDRYDVAARAGREVPLAELRLMVRSLLAERFKLVAHSEQREMSAYALVLSRADKRFGPGLKKNPDGDECKRLVEQPRNVPAGAVRAAGCQLMANFAAGASRQMGAPVIDATGLVGLFEMSYYYDAAGGFLGRGIEPVGTVDLPQYSTALQEQLGLRLEPRRMPIPVLVIDSVERPTPD